MLRKTLTILSFIGLVLSVGLWGVSYVGVTAYRTELPWQLGVVALRGELSIINIKLSQDAISRMGISDGFGWEYGAPVRATPSEWNWWPRFASNNPSFSYMSIPLYLPVLLFGVWPLWLLLPFRRRRKRRKLGLCMRCGYDLRGLTELRCPECNTPFDSHD